MSLFKELQLFLIRSKVERVKFNNKTLKSYLNQFVIFDFIIVFTASILMALFFFFSDSFKEVFLSKNDFVEVPFVQKILHFCIIAPIIEELTFRIGLKISKLNIAIYLGFNLMAILQILEVIEQKLLIKFLLIIFISLMCFLFLKDWHLAFLKKKFTFFLYFNISFFALVHIGNYSFSHFSQYLFVPILIFPQIFLGIYLSYSRLKFGFFFALFIHFFHNFFFTILNYFF